MFRFRSIRSRLAVTFLLTIIAVMLIVGLFLDQLLERYYIKSLEETCCAQETWPGSSAYLQEEAASPAELAG